MSAREPKGPLEKLGFWLGYTAYRWVLRHKWGRRLLAIVLISTVGFWSLPFWPYLATLVAFWCVWGLGWADGWSQGLDGGINATVERYEAERGVVGKSRSTEMMEKAEWN